MLPLSLLKSPLRILTPFVLIPLAPAVSLKAQDLPDVAKGLQPYIGFHGGQLDKVNTLNGALTLRIPLVSYPQKGALSLSYSVIFNSFGFQVTTACIAAPNPDPFGGVPLNKDCHDTVQFMPVLSGLPQGPSLVMDQALTAGGSSAPVQTQGTQLTNFQGRFYIITPDQSQHPLGAFGTSYASIDDAGYRFVPDKQPAVGSNLANPANNPGFLLADAPGVITDSRGVTYSSTGMSDRDNNSISYIGAAVFDSVGRTVPSSATSTATGAQCPVVQNAVNQPFTSFMPWTVPGYGGDVTYLLCYTQVHIHTALTSNPQSTELDYNMPMLQSIVLPNKTYWGFIYDSAPASKTGTSVEAYGQLMTLIYPTGGLVTYKYSFSPGFCDTQRAGGLVPSAVTLSQTEVTSRTMLDAQGNVVGGSSYTYPEAYLTGSILSATGDLTVTHFTPSRSDQCQKFASGEDVYQGNQAVRPALLQSTAATISFDFAPGQPVLPLPHETASATTLGDGSTSETEKSYAPGLSFSAIDCDYHGLNCTTGANSSSIRIGSPTATTYRDYAGAVIKTDSSTHQWQVDPAYLAANLMDIPAVTSVLDSNNQVAAKTTYTYDEPEYSPGGVRGHTTTTTKLLDQLSGPTPITHSTWNAAGELSASVDAKGNKTRYEYNQDQCDASVLTDTYDALDHHTSGRYNCGSGLLSSLTDVNSQTTQIIYDNMLRLQSVVQPAITLSNGHTANPKTTFLIDDTQNKVTRTTLGEPDPDQKDGGYFRCVRTRGPSVHQRSDWTTSG